MGALVGAGMADDGVSSSKSIKLARIRLMALHGVAWRGRRRYVAFVKFISRRRRAGVEAFGHLNVAWPFYSFLVSSRPRSLKLNNRLGELRGNISEISPEARALGLACRRCPATCRRANSLWRDGGYFRRARKCCRPGTSAACYSQLAAPRAPVSQPISCAVKALAARCRLARRRLARCGW